MKVYLDNNVWVDIEYGNYSIDTFKQADIEYFFSDNIIEELLEAEGNPKVSALNRLQLIDSLCGDNFILVGSLCEEPDLTEKKTVYERYEELQKPFYRVFRNEIKQGLIEGDKVDREKMMSLFGLKRIEMNNIGVEAIMVRVDSLLRQAGINGLEDYIAKTEAVGRALYSTLFNLLDYLCYWQDKKTERSPIARSMDASHSYSAQVCDYLLTNDKRMMAKTKAVYSYLGVKTKVMSPTDFFKEKYWHNTMFWRLPKNNRPSR